MWFFMGNKRKPFFRERTVAQIRAMKPEILASRNFEFPDSSEMESGKKAIIIDFPEGKSSIPAGYVKPRDTKLSQPAARYFNDPKRYFSLDLPRSRDEALSSRATPVIIFERGWINRTERENLGGSWYPLIGTDTVQRIVPNISVFEALRIRNYFTKFEPSSNDKKEIRYFDPKKISLDRGAEALVRVPSREEGAEPYFLHYNHLPIFKTPNARAFVWSMFVTAAEGSRGEPMSEVARINFRDSFNWDSHKIAGYLGIVFDQLKEGNSFPFQMCPFPIPSRRGAQIYDFINNNLLIRDRGLDGKIVTRKPYVPERCSLLNLADEKEGYGAISTWNHTRDGPISDYQWTQLSA